MASLDLGLAGDPAHPAAKPPRRLLPKLLVGLALAAVPSTTGTALYLWLAEQLDDRFGAVVLAVVIVTGIMSPVILAGQPSRTR